MKKDAKAIFLATLEAVSPRRLVEEAIKMHKGSKLILPDQSRLDVHRNVFVAAFGKSAVPMARGALNVLGDHIVRGIASSEMGLMENLRLAGKEYLLLPRDPNSKIKVVESNLANRTDCEAAETVAKDVKKLAEMLREDQVLLTLISGGLIGMGKFMGGLREW